MPALTNEDVQWYVVTRKDSGAHFVLNENYVEAYEREFERVREFDTVEEAHVACAIRQAADTTQGKHKERKMIKAGKLRGEIKKGSKEDEDLRATIRAELLAELKAVEEPKSTGATIGPKTKARTTKVKE